MKGDTRVIAALIQRAIEEQTAIQQYWIHETIFTVQGYPKLAALAHEHREQEQDHYGRIIYRLREIEAMPDGGLNQVHTGDHVLDAFGFDLQGEYDAFDRYSETIALCEEVGDYQTRDILVDIQRDEKHHAVELENELRKIPAMTIQNYLSAQV